VGFDDPHRLQQVLKAPNQYVYKECVSIEASRFQVLVGQIEVPLEACLLPSCSVDLVSGAAQEEALYILM
jgi:hypothetical protein